MGKKRAVESDEMKDSENAGLKRRRPRIDPFTGKEATMTDAATEGQSGRTTPSISEAKKQSKASKKSKRKPRKSSG
ncbi:hypothetical protein SERLADRAFT_376678 [Serpula lacrymans var. lacrymans S7.9]|uniref:Uncharacterized protein n=1 Tax=Serpula lacrymans var. lacrymans (strain S7.9) TaxID=578457 RepID=F8NES7_SERL9|nr:uncharacterized protein SERLADRAFT_376678 [Serpula lacrymans var. lacrymans S7.9]EGO31075.1 hypothetical protein SERLADRAFT_376678 [Serpula lacrymans var. lacrymans S7.9]